MLGEYNGYMNILSNCYEGPLPVSLMLDYLSTYMQFREGMISFTNSLNKMLFVTRLDEMPFFVFRMNLQCWKGICLLGTDVKVNICDSWELLLSSRLKKEIKIRTSPYWKEQWNVHNLRLWRAITDPRLRNYWKRITSIHFKQLT